MTLGWLQPHWPHHIPFIICAWSTSHAFQIKQYFIFHFSQDARCKSMCTGMCLRNTCLHCLYLMGCFFFCLFLIPVHWKFETQRNNYTTSAVYLLTSHGYSRTPCYTPLHPCPPCWRQTHPLYVPHSHRTAIQRTVEWLSQPCWLISRADQRDPASDCLSMQLSVYTDSTSSPSSLQCVVSLTRCANPFTSSPGLLGKH